MVVSDSTERLTPLVSQLRTLRGELVTFAAGELAQRDSCIPVHRIMGHGNRRITMKYLGEKTIARPPDRHPPPLRSVRARVPLVPSDRPWAGSQHTPCGKPAAYRQMRTRTHCERSFAALRMTRAALRMTLGGLQEAGPRRPVPVILRSPSREGRAT